MKLLIKILIPTKNMNIKMQNSYIKNNQIRTKLLLFIDNELQTKIKQNNKNLKFKCEDEIRIGFEETFTQKHTIKHVYSSSDLFETKKNDNSDKSLSTVDGSPKKVIKKSNIKRSSTHSKTIIKKVNSSNKLLNNIIYLNKNNYAINTQSKQLSTLLILNKQKNAAEYLKNLCNNLKISKINKINKRPIKQSQSINLKSKLFNFSQDKKTTRKSNKIKEEKPKKENKCIHSLFRKPHKENAIINSKHQVSRKPTGSILIKFIQNE